MRVRRVPNRTNNPQHSGTISQFMLTRHYAPVLFSRFAARHYATRQRQQTAKGKASAQAPKSKAEATDSTGTTTTIDRNTPPSEDELVEKVEMIRAMSRLHPTLDPWGQRVDTLGAPPRPGILPLTHALLSQEKTLHCPILCLLPPGHISPVLVPYSTSFSKIV